MLYPIELLRRTRRQRALRGRTGSMLTTKVPFVMRQSGFLPVGRFIMRFLTVQTAISLTVQNAKCTANRP